MQHCVKEFTAEASHVVCKILKKHAERNNSPTFFAMHGIISYDDYGVFWNKHAL